MLACARTSEAIIGFAWNVFFRGYLAGLAMVLNWMKKMKFLQILNALLELV